MSDEHPNITRSAPQEWTELPTYMQSRDPRFGMKMKRLGAGGKQLGCTLYEVAPGKRAFPYHYHLANEEALYILHGAGTLRLCGAEHPVSAGDYVSLPTGEAGAHQLINTGTEPLRYLCVSTKLDPDIAVYPDSGKLGTLSAIAGGVRKIFRMRDEAPYWEGEEG